MSSVAYNSPTAVMRMGNVSVRQASAAMTAQSLYVSPWPTGRTDHHGKVTSVIAKMDGKASTAMSAPRIKLAMP